MPKIKTSGVKYPDGWELIEPTLSELHSKMREGLSAYPISLQTCALLVSKTDAFLTMYAWCS